MVSFKSPSDLLQLAPSLVVVLGVAAMQLLPRHAAEIIDKATNLREIMVRVAVGCTSMSGYFPAAACRGTLIPQAAACSGVWFAR